MQLMYNFLFYTVVILGDSEKCIPLMCFSFINTYFPEEIVKSLNR